MVKVEATVEKDGVAVSIEADGMTADQLQESFGVIVALIERAMNMGDAEGRLLIQSVLEAIGERLTGKLKGGDGYA